MRRCQIVLLALLFFVGPAHAKTKAKSQPKQSKSLFVQSAGKFKKSSKNTAVYSKWSEDLPYTHYIEIIKAMDLAIGSLTDPGEISKAREGRAVALINAARARLIEGNDTAVDNVEKNILRRARADAKWITQHKTFSPILIAKGYFILGYADVLEGKSAGAIQNLERALAGAPKASYAPWAEILVAEEYFEANQFKQALKYYAKHAKDRSSPYNHVAMYKFAWSLVNLGSLKQGEIAFKNIIVDKRHKFRSDSIKDLVFLLIRFRSQAYVVQTAKELFPDTKDEHYKEFIKTAFINFEQKNRLTLQSPIVIATLEVEDDPLEIAKIYLSTIKGAQREYADAGHKNTIFKFYTHLKNAKIYASSRSFDTLKDGADIETQNFIKAYYDTYSGKVQSPGNTSKKELAQTLFQILPIYLEYFPQTNKISEIYSLWSFVCTTERDFPCLIQLSDRAMDDKHLSIKDKETHYLGGVSALEKMVKLDKEHVDKWSDKLLDSLIKFVKAFPKSKQRLTATKRIVELYVERKNFKYAFLFSKFTYKFEPTAANFYTYQWINYQLEKYSDIIENPDNAKHRVSEPRIDALIKESALKIVADASKSSNFGKLEKYTAIFVANNGDRAKVLAAYDNVIILYLKDKQLDRAMAYIAKLPPEFQQDNHILSRRVELCLQFVYQANFEGCEKTIRLGRSSPDFETLLVYFQLASGVLNLDSLERRPDKDAFISGTLLLDPQRYVNYMSSQKKALSKPLKLQVLLALRLAAKQDVFAINSYWRTSLKDLLPDDFNPAPQSKILSSMAAFVPSSDRKVKADDAIAKNLPLILDSRKKFDLEIKKLRPTEQIELLEKLSNYEKDMGTWVMNANMPADLTPAEQEEFKTALTQQAQQFVDQSKVYSDLKADVEKALDELSKKTGEAAPPKLTRISRWNWPSSLMNKDEAEGLSDLIKNKQWKKAYVLNELLLANKISTPEEHVRVRSGILLNHNPSPPMAKYVFDELQRGGQSAIIDSWRETYE